MESFSLKTNLSGFPEVIYNAWLNPLQHAEFIGAEARIEPFQEGTFNIADGYITGRNLLLDPPFRIIQAWRTTDFPPESPASELELLFEKKGNNTLLILNHSNIPDGMGEELKQGWQEHYFEPMKAYFSQLGRGPEMP